MFATDVIDFYDKDKRRRNDKMGTRNVVRLVQGRLSGENVPESPLLLILRQTVNILLDIDELQGIEMSSKIRNLYDVHFYCSVDRYWTVRSLASFDQISERRWLLGSSEDRIQIIQAVSATTVQFWGSNGTFHL